MGLIIRGAIMAARKAVQVAIGKLKAALKPIAMASRRAERSAHDFKRSAAGLKGAGVKVGVRIDGLKAFRKELRTLANPTTWTSALREVNRDAATVALAEVQRLARSQPRIIGQRRRPERGHWADYVGNYRVVASQTSAGVRLGTTTRRGGWDLGSNFGSIGKKQFPPQGNPDHALYKGIERATPKVVERYDRELGRLAKKAFPD